MSSGLGDFLEEGLQGGLFAGAAVGVLGYSGRIEEAYAGNARISPSLSPVTPATLWDLASLTKPLAGAALALGLAEDGLWSLDDPISRFHDLYRRTRFEGVTLRGLLAHTSGSPSWFPCYVRGEGRAAYRKTLASLDAEARPGTSVLYSCLGYLMLADALETAAGAWVHTLFRDRVASPLGLERDLLFSPAGPDQDRSAGGEQDDATERAMVAERGLTYAGFRTGDRQGEVNDGNAYRRGAGVSLNAGLFGTLRALLEAGRAWISKDPRLLRRESFEDAVRAQTGELDGPRGLGWQVAAAANAGGSALGEGSYGHTGFTGASLFVDPGAGLVLALVTNRLHPRARPIDMNAYRRRFHELAARGDQEVAR